MTVSEQAQIPTKPTGRSTHRRSGKNRPWLGQFRRDVSGRGLAADSRIWPMPVAS